MRTLVIGRVMVILIRWIFKRGRFHEVFKGGIEVSKVFEVVTLFLEDLNK
jgi:hypothetical protein